MTLTTPIFQKNIFSGHIGTIPGSTNLKFVSLGILELLAFNVLKFMGSRDPHDAHFSKTFVRGHVGTMPRSTSAKFEVGKFTGSRDPGHAYCKVINRKSLSNNLYNP